MALAISGDRVDRGRRLRPREPLGRVLRRGCSASRWRSPGSRPISAAVRAASASASSSRSLLVGDAEILLLDEPDNFLDIPAKRWLEQRLRSSPKTILFISHDRELLAAVADAVVTLEGFGAWTHPGELGHLRRGPPGPQPRRSATLSGAGRTRSAGSSSSTRSSRCGRRSATRTPRRPTPPSTAGSGSSRSDPRPRRRPSATSGCGSRAPTAAGSRSACRPAGAVGPHRPVRPRGPLRRPRRGARSERHRQVPPAAPARRADGRPRGRRCALGARVEPGLFHQTDEVAEFRGRTPLAILRDRDLPEEPAMRALARYGLTDCARREVETMSGGQRARLQVLTPRAGRRQPPAARRADRQPRPRLGRGARGRARRVRRAPCWRSPTTAGSCGASTASCCSTTTARSSRPSTSTPRCTRVTGDAGYPTSPARLVRLSA